MQGGTRLYSELVRPWLVQHEARIDQLVDSVHGVLVSLLWQRWGLLAMRLNCPGVQARHEVRALGSWLQQLVASVPFLDWCDPSLSLVQAVLSGTQDQLASVQVCGLPQARRACAGSSDTAQALLGPPVARLLPQARHASRQPGLVSRRLLSIGTGRSSVRCVPQPCLVTGEPGPHTARVAWQACS